MGEVILESKSHISYLILAHNINSFIVALLFHSMSHLLLVVVYAILRQMFMLYV